MADLKQKARELLDLKAEHERARIAYENAKREHKAAEAEFWHELDEDLGVKTVTLELGEPHGTVALGRRETVKGRVIDAETAVKALRAAGLGEAVLKDIPQVRQKVLNEHVRDLLKSGAQLPEGVDFMTTRYIQVTKKK
jgi:hypothetical protein